ncbi:hypothetical protein PIB30_001733 [Stylosanthes scabra]|uniref:Transposase (putative) gypsy type domain-containing protein n=1 Tax=Stylosanthes scabra TaxID=79078 RepID=A0ABU6V2G0_9FABA|nr:hypothetical protein [Stylosanthes scabra]
MNFRRPPVWRRLCHFSSDCLRVRLFVARHFASLFVDVAERVVTFARFSKGRVVGAVSKISVTVPSLVLVPFWILEAVRLRLFFSPISRFSVVLKWYFLHCNCKFLFIYKKSEIGKKKTCQDVRVPCPLNAEEARLYGWVEGAVLTQPSLVGSDSLPEFRRNYPLREDSGAEGDYVLETTGPPDRVPFRAGEDRPHFLWAYQELFTRLRMRLPFSDFQRDVMTRCRVAVSQLHLNGWGFILAFEKVCLHYGFRPTIRLFLYIYDVHFPPGGYEYISFRSCQGRRLFDSYEESIQEFKWHYFKILAAPRKQAFWLDHENKPFPWVYWNPKVKDFVVYNLEPLEMAAFKFLVSLPSGLPKRTKFTFRFILDGSNAEVGKLLDDLLDVKMKRTKLDDLMAKMADPTRMGPRQVLPTGRLSAMAAAAAAASATAGTSTPAAVGSSREGTSIQVPPAPATSEAKKAKKQLKKCEQITVVDLEDELKEDPATDLQQQRRRKKPKFDEAFEKAIGDDPAWEHKVDPLRVAFPEDFD